MFFVFLFFVPCSYVFELFVLCSLLHVLCFVFFVPCSFVFEFFVPYSLFRVLCTMFFVPCPLFLYHCSAFFVSFIFFFFFFLKSFLIRGGVRLDRCDFFKI